jgi:hypothetical protein
MLKCDLIVYKTFFTDVFMTSFMLTRDLFVYNTSVCVCVCVYVCPAIRFHSSQRIFSKFGGKPSTGHDTFRGPYMLCVHTTRARARAVRMY